MALVALLYAAALLALWHVYRNPPDSATRLLAATFIAAIVAWVVVSTVFGTDIYRSPRSMASEIVTMTVITAAAFSLARSNRHGRTVALAARPDA
jgi:ABC-type transport system involved in cytochrome c biogenesis permease subunit